MFFDFLTLDDVKVKGKTVFLRVDINSPLDPRSRRILNASRIRAILPTLEDLIESKVVFGAHQSRPGKYDFTSLETHSKVLQLYIDQKVKYTDDIIGTEAQEMIKNLKTGEILVLNNLRMMEEENIIAPLNELAKTEFVEKMTPLIDLFVNDAFAAAHRSQPSLIGISNNMPMIAGRLMEKELQALNHVLTDPPRPSVYLLGGAKVEDRMPVIKRVLRDEIADKILIGGLVRNIFHIAKKPIRNGYEKLSDNEKELVDDAKTIIGDYPDKIVLPVDVALDEKGERIEILSEKLTDESNIYDIGLNTIARFSDIITKAGTVVAEGPLGMFERRGFDIGTKELLRCMARCQGYTVVGGGHMGAMASMLDVTEQMNHVSTGGGAMLSMLAGETLPVVAALEKSKKEHPEIVTSLS